MAVELAIECDAVISYKSDPDDTSSNWTRFLHAENPRCWRNGSIVLDGRLNIAQKTTLGLYSITYDPSQYEVVDFFAVQKERKIRGPPSNEKSKKSKKKGIRSVQEIDHVNYNQLSWKIRLNITGTKTLDNYETSPGWQDGHKSPEMYPLALIHDDFKQLEIEISSPATGKYKVENWHEARVLKLLHGQQWDPRFTLSDFLDAERTAIHAERLDELLDVGRMNRGACKVETSVVGGPQVLLMIHPKNAISADEWPSVLPQGSIINVSSKDLFNETRGLSRSRPNGVWTARVDYSLGSAPICALLREQIPTERLVPYYEGSDPTFAFTPQRLDITSQNGLSALEKFKCTLPNHVVKADDVMAKLQPTNLINSVHKLPVKQILLESEEPTIMSDALRQNATFVDLTCLPAGVSEEKRSAMKNVFLHPVSLIHGPPGSGKTLALAAIAEALLDEGTTKKILICTATNNAVDRIIETLKEHVTRVDSAKIVSHKVADDELFAGTGSDPYGTSLHAQCMKEIEVSLEKFPAYTNGVEVLREKKSHFDDEEQKLDFRNARDIIIKRFLGKTPLVVCTLASSCLPVLANFKPDVLLIDDTPRAKTYEVLMPLMRFGSTLSRLALTGDPKELGSKFTTARGAKQWKVSLLEKLLNRGLLGQNWPVTHLTEVYRAHPGLHSLTKGLFYEDEHISCLATKSNSLMDSFESSLPITVTGHQCEDLKLTGFTHFIDVPWPKTRTNHIGSSWSRVESEVIMNVVKSLLSSGICALSDILVETFYAGQVNELRSSAARHKVIQNEKDKSLAISTVHGAQGLEANVVILSLTRGGSQNLYRSMMNTKPVVNVAFSRARNIFIVVGDWMTASSKHSLYEYHNDLLPDDRGEQRGLILSRTLQKLQTDNKGFVIRNFQVDMTLADSAEAAKARKLPARAHEAASESDGWVPVDREGGSLSRSFL